MEAGECVNFMGTQMQQQNTQLLTVTDHIAIKFKHIHTYMHIYTHRRLIVLMLINDINIA